MLFRQVSIFFIWWVCRLDAFLIFQSLYWIPSHKLESNQSWCCPNLSRDALSGKASCCASARHRFPASAALAAMALARPSTPWDLPVVNGILTLQCVACAAPFWRSCRVACARAERSVRGCICRDQSTSYGWALAQSFPLLAINWWLTVAFDEFIFENAWEIN